MKDVIEFIEACVNIPNHAYSNRAFYNIIQKLDVDDYRLYFMKAACEYHQKISITKAKDNIDKALSMMDDNIKLDNVTVMSVIDSINTTVFHPSFFDSIDRNYYRIYQLAAEIYADMGLNKQSRDFYKTYYFEANRVKPNEEIRDKDYIILYSFRKYSDYSLQDLINNEITCVCPSKMNDPFDSLANYIGDPTRLVLVCDKEKHIVPQSQTFDHFTIRSFVANRKNYEEDDRIVFNKVMWAHYADCHKGFCIKYKFKRDSYVQFDEENCSFTRIIPVKYTVKKIGIDTKLNTDNSFAMKDMCWEYENEVRLLHFEGNCGEDHYSIKLGNDVSIEEIIFGIRCPEDAKRTMANLVYKKCKLSEIYNEDCNIYNLMKREYPLT